MNDLISRSALKEQAMDILDKWEFFLGQRAGRELWGDKPKEVQDEDIADFCRDIEIVRKSIETSPSVDAVEVVHGEWKWNGKHWECSNCRHDRLHDLVLGLDAAYCPYCGADMRERKGDGADD